MSTTTTTTEAPETTTTTTEAQETTTTTTEASTEGRDNARENLNDQESGLPENTVGAGTPAASEQSREDMLKSAGSASPASPDNGLKDGTQVLGHEKNRSNDQEDAKREALANGARDVKNTRA